jgi:hypothetical protein
LVLKNVISVTGGSIMAAEPRKNFKNKEYFDKKGSKSRKFTAFE